MKINILTGPSFPVPAVQGGAVQKIWLDLAKEFVRLGNDVVIYSREYKDFPRQEILEGIKHIRFGGFDQNKNVYIDLIKDFFYAWRLSKQIEPADIIITNDFWLPYFTSKNSSLGKTIVNVGRYPKKQFFLYKNVDSIISVSKAINSAVLEEAPYLKTIVDVVSNPINENFLNLNFEELIQKKEKNKILFVGRINKEKGVELLINSFKLINHDSKPELVLIGPYKEEQGGSGEEYYNYLKKRSLDYNITFLGPIFDHKKLLEEYKSCDVFCYPSLAEKGEAFGVAPLEAMATGAVTIVSNLECFKDFVIHNKNSYIFNHREANSEKLLSQTIEKALEKNDINSNIRINAIKTAKNFSTEKIAQNFISIFEKLLEQA